MRNIIADEASEEFGNSFSNDKNFDFGIVVSCASIKTEQQSQKVNKAIGDYVIITSPKIILNIPTVVKATKKVLVKHLKRMLKDCGYKKNSHIFIVGLGSHELTSDKLGMLSVRKILVTRGMGEVGLTTTSCFSPDVSGKTGIDTHDLVYAVIKETTPDIVLVIDSLATNSLSRLGTSFQITNSQMVPGGATKRGKGLSFDTLRVPFLAIGVPTMFYQQSINKNGEPIYFACAESEKVLDVCSQLIADSINDILFPTLSKDEVAQLIF